MTNDPTLTPDEGDNRPTPDSPEVPGSGRYAVYDTAHERFVSLVFDTRKAADEAKPEGPRGRYKVREV